VAYCEVRWILVCLSLGLYFPFLDCVCSDVFFPNSLCSWDDYVKSVHILHSAHGIYLSRADPATVPKPYHVRCGGVKRKAPGGPESSKLVVPTRLSLDPEVSELANATIPYIISDAAKPDFRRYGFFPFIVLLYFFLFVFSASEICVCIFFVSTAIGLRWMVTHKFVLLVRCLAPLLGPWLRLAGICVKVRFGC
jgi:hypothetical protein